MDELVARKELWRGQINQSQVMFKKLLLPNSSQMISDNSEKTNISQENSVFQYEMFRR